MKEIFASSFFGLTGLLIFFLFFVAMLIWIFRPGTANAYRKHAQIPLEENSNE